MLREELERDRLEMAAELAHPGPDTGLERPGLPQVGRAGAGFATVLAMVSGENLQENPIFNGKNHGFRLRFSP